jgi:hypothetical protein
VDKLAIRTSERSHLGLIRCTKGGHVESGLQMHLSALSVNSGSLIVVNAYSDHGRRQWYCGANLCHYDGIETSEQLHGKHGNAGKGATNLGD